MFVCLLLVSKFDKNLALLLNTFKFANPPQHINGAESSAAKKAYVKCRTGSNPLHWANYCADQDAATAAAIQTAVEDVGESRSANWQYCQIHTLKGSHRKFSRDSQSKTFIPSVSDPTVEGLGCTGCAKIFRNKAGLATHRRFCKRVSASSKGPTDSGNALDPLLRMNNISSKEGKAYRKKLGHWLLLRKNRELRNGIRSFKAYRCNPGSNDINLKHRLKRAASSIVGCVQNDHSLCESWSFVCQGGADPYLYLLPNGRPISPMPTSVKSFIQESVNDVFCTSKLDRLIYRGGVQTTSHVEAVHRTIRAAAPKVSVSQFVSVCLW